MSEPFAVFFGMDGLDIDAFGRMPCQAVQWAVAQLFFGAPAPVVLVRHKKTSNLFIFQTLPNCTPRHDDAGEWPKYQVTGLHYWQGFGL
jgi:hypothetical protein